MPFTMPSFPLMNMQQASPIAAAMQTALAGQKARQAGMETRVLPQQLQALLMKQQAEGSQAKTTAKYLPHNLQALLDALQQKGIQAHTTTQMQPAVTQSEITARLMPYLIAQMMHPVKSRVPGSPTSQIDKQWSNAMGIMPHIGSQSVEQIGAQPAVPPAEIASQLAQHAQQMPGAEPVQQTLGTQGQAGEPDGAQGVDFKPQGAGWVRKQYKGKWYWINASKKLALDDHGKPIND